MDYKVFEEAVEACVNEKEIVDHDGLYQAFADAIEDNGTLLTCIEKEDLASGISHFMLLADDEGNEYLPVFTNVDELKRAGGNGQIKSYPIDTLIKFVIDNGKQAGMVINPAGQVCKLNLDVLWGILEKKPQTDSDTEFYNRMIQRAIRFALEFHGGKTRKGTTEPFITHPMEVMSIMNAMNLVQADPRLVIAGILHDTVEDTDATIEMIIWNFGYDVAKLVAFHTEDKSLTWKERKQQAINDLEEADDRCKILVMADMLANLRSMLRDVRLTGDQIWERFNAPPQDQCWYYSQMQEALYSLQVYEDVAPLYREMVETYQDIFMMFLYDREAQRIFRFRMDGVIYVTGKDSLEPGLWQEDIPENVVRVDRRYAERMEDNWAEFYFEKN